MKDKIKDNNEWKEELLKEILEEYISRLLNQKEKEYENYIRLNDISSWLEYGKKREYDKFFKEELIKKIEKLDFGGESGITAQDTIINLIKE